MNSTEIQPGCEDHLYKPTQCCLHPCNTIECPEPICAIEFLGGIRAYQKFRSLMDLLKQGLDLHEAAGKLGINFLSAKYLFKKGVLISGGLKTRR